MLSCLFSAVFFESFPGISFSVRAKKMKGRIKEVALRDPGGQRKVLAQGTYVLGRGAEWSISDKRCSRKQAELTVTDTHVSIVVVRVSSVLIFRGGISCSVTARG